MKIGMMAGWNTDSGASFHAELIGRAWVEQGHKLTVFTFYDYAFHGTNITAADEDYVIRCFTVEGYTPAKLDPVPFLTEDYEIFVVQDLGMLPKDLLAKIFHRIKKKAKTVNVIHDGDLSKNPSFYQFSWDAVVGFDIRYINFLKKVYDKENIHMIPYPSYPIVRGDKLKARKKLNLPEDKKIIFCFGPASKTVVELIPAIAQLSNKYAILLLVITVKEDIIEEFKKRANLIEIEIRKEVPDIERLYDYLHAVDVLVFNKYSTSHAVVSSTAFQCMGSLCPIVARSSNYVEYYNREVLKYTTLEEFKHNIEAVFNETDELKITLAAAEKYVREKCDKVVAESYIKLFKSLLKG